VSPASAAAVWPISAALVLALDDHLGPPLDGYVNGTQTWLTDDALDTATLEWQLHPVGGYTRPRGVSHHDLWDVVISAVRSGASPDALPLGAEHRSLSSLWEGLECFPAYGAELEPAGLAAAARARLGLAAQAAGLVDHDRIGDAWTRSNRARSLMGMLLEELDQRP